jgi:hypothetical protein
MQRVHHIVKRSLDFDPPGSTLSFSYGAGGCSFCVHDASDRLTMFGHVPFENDVLPGTRLARLKEVIAAEPLLARNYRKVLVMASQREKMLVPDPFFREERLPLLWSLHREPLSDDRFLHHPVEEWGARVVGVIAGKARQLFRQLLPGCHFLPDGLPFLRLSHRACPPDGACLFADIHDDYFDLLLTRDQRPLLFNTFRYQTGNDVLYFMLNAARSCHVDEQQARLCLAGNLSEGGKLYKQLSRYWHPITLATEPALNALLQDPTFNSSPFVHLLNLHACES